MDADAFPRSAVYAPAGRLLADRPQRGCHRRPRQRRYWRHLVTLALLLCMAAGTALALAPGQAHASTAPSAIAALRWAEGKAGHPYVWGGTGPGYDCSGLVYEAYLRQGVNIGRDTYDMLANSHLVRIPASERQRGDLAFYGTGHVELVTERGTFGALEPGTLVGWHRPSGSWRPTMYYRVR
jgi:hypothetical protein